jgi:parallel beta-helix repeat protein
VISWNSIKDNGGFGIYLASSVSNRIFGNNVTSNSLCGIQVDAVSNLNTIYNNYFSNSVNAKDDGQNYWNVSMTAGVNIIGGPYLAGNYWSWNYTGADTNNDTIGDTLLPYNCGGNIVNGGDWLPLTPPTFQPIGDLNISGILCPIVAVSNSTISGFSFNNTAFWFNVSGMEGASGYCAIIVPTGLNLSDYVVYINGTSWPYTLSSNGTHYYIHITYTHSKSEITVQSLGGFVPEFPFLGTTILLAAAVIIFWTYKGCRRRLHYQRIPAN